LAVTGGGGVVEREQVVAEERREDASAAHVEMIATRKSRVPIEFLLHAEFAQLKYRSTTHTSFDERYSK
jgi:hypothetical protein